VSNEPITGPRVPRAHPSLITIIRDRAPQLATAIAVGEALWPAAAWARGKARDRRMYTVKISGADDIYPDVHEWVLGLLPPADRRALIACSSSSRASDGSTPLAASSDGRPPAPVLRLQYDGSRVQMIRVDGHPVKVAVYDLGRDTGQSDSAYWKPPEIMFTAQTLEGRQAVLAAITSALARNRAAQRTPAFRMLGPYGWDRLEDLPPRPMESVILPDGQAEGLRDDLARFLASEQDYTRRGIPWHRGYLFSGPPGTGKTSIARALAGAFGLDLWYLPLSDVRKDGELLRLAARVSPRSVLLLEDVDVFKAATERTDDGKATLSGLLNALDGIATPHGLVTIMTTNDMGALDPAVIRPGRVDLVEQFGPATPGQLARMISHWYGVPVTAGDTAGVVKVTPAQVIEACKRNDEPGSALADLRAQTFTNAMGITA
jgi:hypothetical protein